MNKFLTTSALLLLLVTQAFSYSVTSPVSQQHPDGEEHAVYAVVVEKLFAGNKVAFDTQSPINLLVIQNQTAVDSIDDWILAENLSGDFGDHVRHWLSTMPQEAVEDYRIKNKESRRLTGDLSLKIEHVLVEKDELDQYRKGGRWEDFYKVYPGSGGFISFSRVGFDSKGGQAIVYFEHWCHRVCGSGIYLLLNKDREGWKVTKVSRAWIS